MTQGCMQSEGLPLYHQSILSLGVSGRLARLRRSGWHTNVMLTGQTFEVESGPAGRPGRQTKTSRTCPDERGLLRCVELDLWHGAVPLGYADDHVLSS